MICPFNLLDSSIMEIIFNILLSIIKIIILVPGNWDYTRTSSKAYYKKRVLSTMLNFFKLHIFFFLSWYYLNILRIPSKISVSIINTNNA